MPTEKETDEKPSLLPKKVQEVKKEPEPIVEMEKQDQVMAPAEEIIQEPEPEPIKRKSSNSDYLHAGEDFYNTKGYEAGRYNLRRRGQKQKYYEEGPDGEDDQEFNKYDKSGSNNDFKQNPRGPNPGYGRRGPNESNYPGKPKRKKKDDDEDYVAEEDEDAEDNEDYSPNKNLNNMNPGTAGRPNFNPGQMGNNGLPQFGNFGMMGNQMQGQFPIGKNF